MASKIQTITIVSFILVSLGLSACGTLQGVGQDLQTVGETLENAVE